MCDQLKNARTHAHRTHIFKAFSHAHAHVRPHIARVRARTHLRNSRLGLLTFKKVLNQMGNILIEFESAINVYALVIFQQLSNFRVLKALKMLLAKIHG